MSSNERASVSSLRDYLFKAEEAEQEAAIAKDEASRAKWIKVAAFYREMARTA